MEDSENQWIENILESTKGSGRAKPSAKVWGNIVQETFGEERHVVPMNQWRIAAVAAVLLIAINVFSIHQYLQSTASDLHGITTENRSSQSIISNYQLYD